MIIEDLEHLRKAFESKVNFNENEWEEIHPLWHTVEFKKGEFLTQEGQIERRLYFSCQGVQSLSYLSLDGTEMVLGFTFPYYFSGIYDSFIAQKPANTNLVALTDSRMLYIQHQDMMDLFDTYRSVERWGRLFVEEILFGRGRREIELASMRAKERFDVFMARCPRVLKSIPQKYLASYLEMTPETFSRLRKNIS
jgi:CRP-like cAMP-binding protein